jgi:hypothetical protein
MTAQVMAVRDKVTPDTAATTDPADGRKRYGYRY